MARAYVWDSWGTTFGGLFEEREEGMSELESQVNPSAWQ